MPNRTLSEREKSTGRSLLKSIQTRIKKLSAGDRRLYLAYNRWILKHLIYDERGTPAQRKKLKKQLYADQGGRCAACKRPLEPEGRNAELDRFDAFTGYVATNTQLLHHSCHREDQERKKFH